MSLSLRRPPTFPKAESSPAKAQVNSESPNASGTLLTPSQAADILAVKVNVLERWRSTGEGPRFVRLSRKSIRYRAVDLSAFVEGRVVASTAAGTA
jgi:hypothetical protein